MKKKFLKISKANFTCGVCNTETNVESAIKKIVDQAKKSYGDCDKCYGKGYSTELTSVSWGADFAGDKPGSKTLSNVNYCSCSRGEQMEQVLGMVYEQGRRDAFRFANSTNNAVHEANEMQLDYILDDSDGNLAKKYTGLMNKKNSKYTIEESHKYPGCFNVYETNGTDSGPMVAYFDENDNKNEKRAISWVKKQSLKEV